MNSSTQSNSDHVIVDSSESGLLVEKLNHQYSEYMVKRLFRGFGRVIKVTFVDSLTAAVYFDMVTSADAAMRALRGKEIDGNNLLICKLTRDGGFIINEDTPADFAEFARQAVQQSQISRVNALIGVGSKLSSYIPDSAPLKTGVPENRQYHINHASSMRTPQSQPTGPNPSVMPKEEMLKLLEDEMAAVGTVTLEDVQGMSDADKITYLREFVAPIVGAVEKDKTMEVTEAILTMGIERIVQAINYPEAMFAVIAEVREQKGL